MKTKEKRIVKKKQGISLIVLVITIIVIIILAAAVILTVNNNNPMSNANRARYESDRASIQGALTSAIGVIMGEKLCKVTVPQQEDITAGIQYVLSGANDGSRGGTIGWEQAVAPDSYWMGVKKPNYGTWKVNHQGLIVVEVDGIIYGGDGESDSPSSDNGFDDNGNTDANVSKIMKPVLNGMTPVKVNAVGDGFETTTAGDKDWYRYVLQDSDQGLSYWANAQTAEGSQFVWIPRYAYRIGTVTGNGMSKQGPIDVKFIDMNNKDTDGNELPSDYKIHPAFTFGDQQLAGIWVAKFEASSNSNKIQSKPGVTSWKNINVSSIFDYCYQMATESSYGFVGLTNGDSHMMKNKEWGAIAYLTHSPYGRKGVEIKDNNHDSFQTGGGYGNAYLTNVNQSTTNNISGVYDLSGGAAEYVTGNFKYTLGSAGSRTYFDQIFNQPGYEKYFDIYDSDNQYGDALNETTSWFYDNCTFVTASSPYFIRGGRVGNASGAGIFAYESDTGATENRYGFRPVIASKPLS